MNEEGDVRLVLVLVDDRKRIRRSDQELAKPVLRDLFPGNCSVGGKFIGDPKRKRPALDAARLPLHDRPV